MTSFFFIAAAPLLALRAVPGGHDCQQQRPGHGRPAGARGRPGRRYLSVTKQGVPAAAAIPVHGGKDTFKAMDSDRAELSRPHQLKKEHFFFFDDH